MKLELKHLAPYLPYKLNVIDYSMEMEKRSLKRMGIEPRETEIDEMFELNSMWEVGRKYKPILRPLSDIIKYSDERFDDSSWSRKLHIGDVDYENIRSGRISMISYGTMQKLFKNHFDVFGLIENGLAIDINTLD